MTKSQAPADGQETDIIEGLPGHLPVLVGSMVFMFSAAMFFRLRGALHANSNEISFDTMGIWATASIALLVVAVPLAHQVAHVVALLTLKAPIRWERAGLYPHVWPAAPLARAQARWFLLAPLALSALLLVLLPFRPLSSYAALCNALNLAMWVGDGWKALGLRRFPPATRFEIGSDGCRVRLGS